VLRCARIVAQSMQRSGLGRTPIRPMRLRMRQLFDDRGAGLPRKVAGIYAIIIVANVAAWVWAITALGRYPVLFGAALLAYGFGLRHAVDADHIAAIDNVTRKLMQDGKRPVAVGFYFSLGHSTIVFIATVAVAATALVFQHQLGELKVIGGVIGTSVSALFLLLIALINVVILVNVSRTFRRVKAGHGYVEEDFNALLAGRGLLSRVFGPMFRLIRRSWHMYPLGFLFGLGFDTATEIGLLGISAAQAAKGLPIWSILVFPALFTAGMCLVDTTDGVLMLGAYGWAFANPLRKLYYNITITFVSVIVALLVGGIEALGLIAQQFHLDGELWEGVRALNDNFGALGYVIVGVFVVCWIASAVIYRLRGYGRLEAEV
jgi:nickel/cobalt transporter (NiCoT) family protein